MKFDKSLIPRGEYCYFIKIRNEYKNVDFDDVKNFWKYYEGVNCPYWSDTGFGMAHCKYLNQYSIFEYSKSDGYNKALKYFGSEEELEKHHTYSLLFDRIKSCGINHDEDDENTGGFEEIDDTKYQRILDENKTLAIVGIS